MSPDGSLAESSRDCVTKSAQLISRAGHLIGSTEARVAAFWECRVGWASRIRRSSHIRLPLAHSALNRTLTKTLPLAPYHASRLGPAEPPSRVTLGLPPIGPSG